MANTPTSPTTNTEWRSGRPSFKAFYPEIFLLTLITIAFIALGAKLSCNAVKKAKAENAPTEVTAVSLFGAYAFGQDADLNQPASEEPVADAPDAEADGAEATPAADEEPATSDVNSEKSLLPTADQASETGAAVAESAAPSSSEPARAKGATPWNKILWIWVCCLIIPLALWIWRGANWICAVYGVEYELRVDEENPRATTFLIKRGIFNKTTDSMHIGAVKDVKSIQSFWQKYFKGGVGTIWLYTNDKTDDKVEMKNMPEPSRIFNAFDTLRKHYWARGGMQLAASADAGEPLGDDGSFDHEMEIGH